MHHIDDRIRRLAGGSGPRWDRWHDDQIQRLRWLPDPHKVIVAAGTEPDVLPAWCAVRIWHRFLAEVTTLRARKRWILPESPRGTITVDAGAAQALTRKGKSLLAVGITEVRGNFDRGQTVRLLDPDGKEIARGITHYNTADLLAIKGLHSDEIAAALSYEFGPTVVHRDDLVLV